MFFEPTCLARYNPSLNTKNLKNEGFVKKIVFSSKVLLTFSEI